MAYELSSNEKMTIKAIKIAIANVFDEIKENLTGTRSEKKKNKLLIKRFSLELINSVVNNFDELEGVAKILKEVSASIDTFAEAIKTGKGEEIANYLISQTTQNQAKSDNNSGTKNKKSLKKESVVQEEKKSEGEMSGNVEKVNQDEIAEIKQQEAQKREERKKQQEEQFAKEEKITKEADDSKNAEIKSE